MSFDALVKFLRKEVKRDPQTISVNWDWLLLIRKSEDKKCYRKWIAGLMWCFLCRHPVASECQQTVKWVEELQLDKSSFLSTYAVNLVQSVLSHSPWKALKKKNHPLTPVSLINTNVGGRVFHDGIQEKTQGAMFEIKQEVCIFTWNHFLYWEKSGGKIAPWHMFSHDMKLGGHVYTNRTDQKKVSSTEIEQEVGHFALKPPFRREFRSSYVD